MKKKNLLTVLFAAGIAFASFNGAFAADRYLCNMDSGYRFFSPGMSEEQFCSTSKQFGDSAYRECKEKTFPMVEEYYRKGFCKKLKKVVYDNTAKDSKCVVEITNDPKDGYFVQCSGPDSASLRTEIEKLYRR